MYSFMSRARASSLASENPASTFCSAKWRVFIWISSAAWVIEPDDFATIS